MLWRSARSPRPAGDNVWPRQIIVPQPGVGQQDKAALCLRQFDDMQCDGLGRNDLRGCLSDIALIDAGRPDALARCILNTGGKTFNRGPVADVSRRDRQDEQVAERVCGHMHGRPTLTLGTVIVDAGTALRRRPQGMAICLGAVGPFVRPKVRRGKFRGSCASVSKQPAVSHR